MTNVALEARDKKLRDQLRATEEDLRLKSSALLEADGVPIISVRCQTTQ